MDYEIPLIFTGPVVNGIARQYYFLWTGSRVEIIFLQ